MPQWQEKDLEDYVWAHPEFIGDAYHHVGRQVKLPNGSILDLMGYDERRNAIIVSELKSGEADSAALTQVASYMAVLRRAIWQLVYDAGEDTDEWDSLCDLEPVLGLIIAPSFTHDLVLAVDAIDNISLRFANISWFPSGVNPKWLANQVQASSRSDALIAALTDCLTLHPIRETEEAGGADGENTVGEDHDGRLDEPEHSGCTVGGSGRA